MRSTSVTPPANPSSSNQPAPMEQDDSSDIVIVSENIRTPNKKSGSPTRPLAATSSPSSKQRRVSHTTAPFPRTGTSQRAKMEVDESETESDKKRGKKRTRKEEEAVDEYKDERLVSEELKLDAFKDEDDKKDVGSSGSPKKRGYKVFTVEEDKIIIERMLNSFDAGPVRIATGRSSTAAVSYRARLILKTALKGLHGEEHATLPGEGSAASSSSSAPKSPAKRQN